MINNYKIRICVICKQEYKPTASNQICCCKNCHKSRKKQTDKIRLPKYYEEHRQELLDYQRKRREENKELIAKQQKEYRQKNKAKIVNNKREYYLKNKEKFSIKAKLYAGEHKEQISEYQEKYRKAHTKELSEYRRNKRKNNIEYKLKEYLRKRLWQVLQGNSKSDHTEKLFGCTASFLKMWLELQFKDGMSWNNWSYKGWHVDHIRPCSSFDLKLSEHQQACCHFTNLQPLWAKDNLKKSDNFISVSILVPSV